MIRRPQKRAPFLYPGEEVRPSRQQPKVRLHGVTKHAIETGRLRLMVTAGLFCCAFAGIGGRLVDLMLLKEPLTAPALRTAGGTTHEKYARADIVDRNGVMVATNLPTVNVYADAARVGDAKDAADKLIGALPEANYDDLLRRLNSGQRFVYLARNLTPAQQMTVNRLGIPGVYFEASERRVYLQGNLFAHAVGTTDPDNRGNSGVEKTFDQILSKQREPLQLSLDLRVQNAVHETLAAGINRFHAEAGTAVVMDVHTGEILGMVSLPDFDPKAVGDSPDDARFNRATLGLYEMGSTFKLFTAAMALDAGTAKLTSIYDATQPIKIGRFTITDFHGLHRPESVPEILIHSSNLGAARMALEAGTDTQKKYLRSFGLLSQLKLELPEVAKPQYPGNWRDINTITIAYGHGISVTPVHVASAVSALVNGGVLIPPTIIKRDPKDIPDGTRVISEGTSTAMRALMRMVVIDGSGKQADVAGYEVGGKTGSSNMVEHGRYSENHEVRASFVAAFPIDAPKYVVIVVLDRPRGTKETAGFVTAGWNAAPTVGTIIAKIAPMLGVFPMGHDDSFAPLPVLQAALPEDSRKSEYATKAVASVPNMMMDELARPTITREPLPVGTHPDAIATLIRDDAPELPEDIEDEPGATQ